MVVCRRGENIRLIRVDLWLNNYNPVMISLSRCVRARTARPTSVDNVYPISAGMGIVTWLLISTMLNNIVNHGRVGQRGGVAQAADLVGGHFT